MMTPSRICVVPRVSGVGGMVSFQHKLVAGLAAFGVETTFDLTDRPYQAVLVVGGTRQVAGLWQARRRGIPVVQRLDGMNWLHRLSHRGAGQSRDLRHYLRAEYGNAILSLIRSRLASHVVYQSRFVRGWWERVHGATTVSDTVIYNGVDLTAYTPDGPHERPVDKSRILLVEGSLMGGYEHGLQVAVQLALRLSEHIKGPVELMVVGRVPDKVKLYWEEHLANQRQSSKVILVWTGLVGRERIPEIDRSAHLLYSSDINAACPNSVIEALACGLPVLAYDTGALPELVFGDAGRVAPYGGDPWQLEEPDVGSLVAGAAEILDNQVLFRKAAREHAQSTFGLEKMIEAYWSVLKNS